MQFETTKSTQEKIGKRFGKITAFFIFSIVVFFVAGKFGICWSLKKYIYFTISLAITIILIENIVKRLNGNEKNKIVS